MKIEHKSFAILNRLIIYGFEALTFNIHGGYLEATVRGHRFGLLTAADYINIRQCETIDDIKTHLFAAEYGLYLQNGFLSLEEIDESAHALEIPKSERNLKEKQ